MKGDKEKQHSISITPKAAVAIVPPKKVRQTSVLRLNPSVPLFPTSAFPAVCAVCVEIDKVA